jgi:hypothetical protein
VDNAVDQSCFAKILIIFGSPQSELQLQGFTRWNSICRLPLAAGPSLESGSIDQKTIASEF